MTSNVRMKAEMSSAIIQLKKLPVSKFGAGRPHRPMKNSNGICRAQKIPMMTPRGLRRPKRTILSQAWLKQRSVVAVWAPGRAQFAAGRKTTMSERHR